MWKLVFIFQIIFAIFGKSLAYFVTIDAHSEECFYEKVSDPGTKLGEEKQIKLLDDVLKIRNSQDYVLYMFV